MPVTCINGKVKVLLIGNRKKHKFTLNYTPLMCTCMHLCVHACLIVPKGKVCIVGEASKLIWLPMLAAQWKIMSVCTTTVPASKNHFKSSRDTYIGLALMPWWEGLFGMYGESSNWKISVKSDTTKQNATSPKALSSNAIRLVSKLNRYC